MPRRQLVVLVSVLLPLACSEPSTNVLAPSSPEAGLQTSKSAAGGRAGSMGVVYVRSQGLYYDTFVSAQVLPPHGPFQKLENGATEYGPGDEDYVGGRWWVDVNGDGVQDAGDDYLLCPLLPPGRTSP